MGYDVHITRAGEWTESDATPITLADWIAVAKDDDEMRLDGFADASTPDGTLRYESEGLAVWTKHSGDKRNGNQAWFDYRRGRIVVKNPDEQILGKMRQLARKLGARVVGDDGEEY